MSIDPGPLLSSVYDTPYEDITAAIIQAMVSGVTSGIIVQRLAELEAEAARLAEQGQALTADNPVVVALLADLENTLRGNVGLMQSVSGDLALAGVIAGVLLAQELALPGFSAEALAAVGWVGLDPNALAAALGYIESEAFAALMQQYVLGTLEQINNVIITGLAQGKGPIAIANSVKQVTQGLPASNAQQIMRTLQLVSSRDAQREARLANEGILEYQVRIAALDHRTCAACVALHGTVYPIDVRIDDHHNGRCTSVTKVVGFPPPDVQSGVEWFQTLPDDQQRSILGLAGWKAWKAGVISLDDFVMPYEDDVFGTMIGTNSLVGILGEAAQEYK